MNSDDELENIDFNWSASGDANNTSDSHDFESSETTYANISSLPDISVDEDLIFSSVHDDYRNEDVYDRNDLQYDDSVSRTSSFTEAVKRAKKHTESNNETNGCLHTNTETNMLTDFVTGKNKSITLTKTAMDQQSFLPTFTRPMRMYNCPEKGHISTSHDEKHKYMKLYEQIKQEFVKVNTKLLKIQYRWAWLDLYTNNNLQEGLETYRMLSCNISTRIKSEYSVLRRILEGDDMSGRYMILLVLCVQNNTVEVYDGYFSIYIEIDDMLQKQFAAKKISLGQKIKLFGCKYLLGANFSILDYDGTTPAIKAFYNSFDYALPNRRLGYRKKKSFFKNIKDVIREGGVVSCIKGKVIRIIETRYVVQVKDYRNVVDNLETELEKIQTDLQKNSVTISEENVKIRKFTNFIFADKTGECLVTAWSNTEDVCVDSEITFFGLVPVLRSIGCHLTTTKKSYMYINKTSN